MALLLLIVLHNSSAAYSFFGSVSALLLEKVHREAVFFVAAKVQLRNAVAGRFRA
jgi:hypothetical protein